MKTLTKKEWIKRIDIIITQYKRLHDICEQAQKLGVMDINGALFDSIWGAFGEMLKMLDYNDWINWHIHENKCGDRKMEAGYDDKVKPIKTSVDLAQLIIHGLARDAK